MNKRRKIIVAVGIAFLAIFFIPLMVPVPSLGNTVPPMSLADPDSLFINVSGLTVHYKDIGNGSTTFILLHGFGASVFSWREVIAPLSDYGRVIAFDRPAFGLTSRPMPGDWYGENPYTVESQAEQTVALMDALGIERAVLVGNSAGGTVSIMVALMHPERVEALILVDPAVYGTGSSYGWIQGLKSLPQVQKWGPYLVRQIASTGNSTIEAAWHNKTKVTQEIFDGYRKPLMADNWDRALWELTIASHPLGIEDRLGELIHPILVITGDDDRVVPTNRSIQLADEIQGARLAVISECGHLPHEECPLEFMVAVDSFMADLP